MDGQLTGCPQGAGAARFNGGLGFQAPRIEREVPTALGDGGATLRALCTFEGACIHESAHAVIAEAVGGRVARACMRRTDASDTDGYVEYHTEGLSAIELAAVALAGGVAATLLGGIPRRAAAAAGARDMADAARRLCKLPEREWVAALHQASELARRLVIEHRAAIERFSSWLAACGEAGPGIVRFFIERAAR